MRDRLLAFVVTAAAASCGGSQRPCVQNGLCGAAAGFVYFSVTDAASGGVVEGATFVLKSPNGQGPVPSARVTSIPDGPFAGPCDCYRVLLGSGPSEVVVQAPGFGQVVSLVDLGHAAPPPEADCSMCEGPPPGSGTLTRVALQKS